MLQSHQAGDAFTSPAEQDQEDLRADEQASHSWIALSAFSGLVAVGLGAFGGHGLRSLVTPEMLAVWRTGVEYQLFHTLAMLALALAPTSAASALRRWPLRLWAAGILLFSGSLYVMVLSGTRAVGIVTPIGGSCFMAGWLLLVWAAWSRRRASARSG
jgi:uncharacterized membrane protein YgdD (TMEM256/DUF423 family)